MLLQRCLILELSKFSIRFEEQRCVFLGQFGNGTKLEGENRAVVEAVLGRHHKAAEKIGRFVSKS
jgi:hypothetical protein